MSEEIESFNLMNVWQNILLPNGRKEIRIKWMWDVKDSSLNENWPFQIQSCGEGFHAKLHSVFIWGVLARIQVCYCKVFDISFGPQWLEKKVPAHQNIIFKCISEGENSSITSPEFCDPWKRGLCMPFRKGPSWTLTTCKTVQWVVQWFSQVSETWGDLGGPSIQCSYHW